MRQLPMVPLATDKRCTHPPPLQTAVWSGLQVRQCELCVSCSEYLPCSLAGQAVWAVCVVLQILTVKSCRLSLAGTLRATSRFCAPVSISDCSCCIWACISSSCMRRWGGNRGNAQCELVLMYKGRVSRLYTARTVSVNWFWCTKGEWS